VAQLVLIFQACRGVILMSELRASIQDELIRNLHDVIDIVPRCLEASRRRFALTARLSG
jgi:hypothetical protein